MTDKTQSWRARLAQQVSSEEQLELIAGDWIIRILDAGEEYSFKRKEQDVFGVAFRVNAKHLTSGGNFPNVRWGVTAKSLINEIAKFDTSVGVELKFKATGMGLQRRYSNISVSQLTQAQLKTELKTME